MGKTNTPNPKYDREMAYERELHIQLKKNWSLGRWIRESQKYMAHWLKWWVTILAIFKWPKFNREQLEDAEIVARIKSRHSERGDD